MKIGILSDTHGAVNVVDTVFAAAPDTELWLYAGDVVGDAQYLATIARTDVRFVPGNCDWPDPNTPETIVVEAAAEANCDIAVYGHTHIAEYSPGTPITVLNPGSAARPRDGALGSFMTMDLLSGKAPEVRLHRLGQR